MTILALDTSTARGSVALLRDGVLVLEEVFTADRSHSSTLFPILQKARALVERVDVLAIGLGPGSYAGVRISIAAALGLSYALGAEMVGFPSVAALESEATEYLAIGDARRETFYFTHVREGVCTDGPRLLTAEELDAQLAALPGLPVYVSAPLPGVARSEVALPLASNIARLAVEGRSIVARGDLEPLYLRDPHITTPKPRI